MSSLPFHVLTLIHRTLHKHLGLEKVRFSSGFCVLALAIFSYVNIDSNVIKSSIFREYTHSSLTRFSSFEWLLSVNSSSIIQFYWSLVKEQHVVAGRSAKVHSGGGLWWKHAQDFHPKHQSSCQQCGTKRWCGLVILDSNIYTVYIRFFCYFLCFGHQRRSVDFRKRWFELKW